MKEVYKTVKGVTYFPSYRYAVGYAIDNGLPTDRVIAYDLGYAIGCSTNSTRGICFIDIES